MPHNPVADSSEAHYDSEIYREIQEIKNRLNSQQATINALKTDVNETSQMISRHLAEVKGMMQTLYETYLGYNPNNLNSQLWRVLSDHRPDSNSTSAGETIIFVDVMIDSINRLATTDAQRDEWWERTTMMLPIEISKGYERGVTTEQDQENLRTYLQHLLERQRSLRHIKFIISRNGLTDPVYVHNIKNAVDHILEFATASLWDVTVQKLQNMFPPGYTINDEPVFGKINLMTLNYRHSDSLRDLVSVREEFFHLIDDAVNEQKAYTEWQNRNHSHHFDQGDPNELPVRGLNNLRLHPQARPRRNS